MGVVTVTATMQDAAELLGDPVAVFGKLVREVEAGTVLVSLALTADETRRAALDALQLARDVLDDAGRQLVDAGATSQLALGAAAELQQLDPELVTDDRDYSWGQRLLPDAVRPGGFTTTRTSCACGAFANIGDDVAVVDGIAHAAAACLATDQADDDAEVPA